MRFTAYNQYVHRMLHRWGPSVRATMAIKKYLKTQRISLKPPPCVSIAPFSMKTPQSSFLTLEENKIILLLLVYTVVQSLKSTFFFFIIKSVL